MSSYDQAKAPLCSPKRAIIVVVVVGGKFLAIDMLHGLFVVPMVISSSSVVATHREISISHSNAFWARRSSAIASSPGSSPWPVISIGDA